MARKTSKESAKVAKKAATKRVAAKATKPREMPPKSRSRKALLAGGNPQIAKADGDAPVQLHRGHAGLETRRRAPPRRAPLLLLSPEALINVSAQLALSACWSLLCHLSGTCSFVASNTR